MVRVTDIEASLKFYRDAIGLELLSRREYPQGRFTLVFLAAPGDQSARVELTRIVLSNDLLCPCAAESRQIGILNPPTPGLLRLCRQPKAVSRRESSRPFGAAQGALRPSERRGINRSYPLRAPRQQAIGILTQKRIRSAAPVSAVPVRRAAARVDRDPGPSSAAAPGSSR